MSQQQPQGEGGDERGRSRGRSRGRLQPTRGPDSRRPGFGPQQQEQQQQFPPEQPSSSLQQRRLPLPRAKAASHQKLARSGEHQVGQITEGLEAVSLTGLEGGGDAGSASSHQSRGGLRSRRYEEQLTKPSGLTCKQGTSGTHVKLKSNYFKLITQTEWALYQYRVDFDPDEERTAVKKGLLRVHKDALGPYIFDGSVLFTARRLPKEPMELYSARIPDDVKIRITIKKTVDLVMGDISYIQFFNIVLRKCIAGLNLQLVGRDYYDARSKVSIDKFNLELWPGYVTSIRQHEDNILLGVDLTNKIMRRDTAFSMLKQLSQRSREDWRDAFTRAIVGMTVITPHNNRTYKVDDVDFESSPLSTFERGNSRISYMDYYYEKYQIRVNNKEQPLLVSRPKIKDIRGARSNNIILIPELCCLTGLSDEMRSNFQLMRELESHTRLVPRARMNQVVGFMNRITSNKQAAEELSLWNLKFSPDLIEFAGRTLAFETVIYGSGKTSSAEKEADWTRSLRGNPMYHAEKFINWCIIFPRKLQHEVETFIKTLINASASLHFAIPMPSAEIVQDDRPGSYVYAIDRAISKMKPQLIMCIVPNNRADRYDAIKKRCSVERGVPSQVVLSKNITTRNVMSIATKIGIQVNCKIGGAPWSIQIPFNKPALIAGFDVCHDTNEKSRSFGALVASLDGGYSKYFSSVSPHTSGEELSKDISVHLVKAVQTYFAIHGWYPPKIIIYRDGVGEGTESYVLKSEVKIIREKLQVFYQTELSLAFIIISKRINTRLFANDGNPSPGTIVDNVITSPLKYDFFLVSQSVRQGTVTPTLYNIIYDTTGLSPEIMQKLAFKMCHLYYNWSGTVRVPAPVQYAHKLAFLCGQHLHRPPHEELNQTLHFL